MAAPEQREAYSSEHAVRDLNSGEEAQISRYANRAGYQQNLPPGGIWEMQKFVKDSLRCAPFAIKNCFSQQKLSMLLHVRPL